MQRYILLICMGPHRYDAPRQLIETRSRLQSLLRYYEAQPGDYAPFIAVLQNRLQELPVPAQSWLQPKPVAPTHPTA